MTQPKPDEWQPLAHVAVADVARRSEIIDTLARRGWRVVVQPTNLHLLDAISGVILGDQPTRRPDMIVVDAIGRGCTGESIADGLRDLGLEIPVMLVAPSTAGAGRGRRQAPSYCGAPQPPQNRAPGAS